MAMTINTEGLTEVSQMLERLGNQAEAVASGALYDGAGVVADAMSAAVEKIVSKPTRFYAVEGHFVRYPTDAEKNALRGKVGIARFNKNGSEVDTLVGMAKNAGYAEIDGKQKPIAEIARSIESGTSFMKKQPVFRRAANQSRSKAEAAIVAKAEQMLNEIINE